MKAIEQIEKILEKGEAVRTSDLLAHVAVSRPTILVALRALIRDGKVVQIANGPQTSYVLATKSESALAAIGRSWGHSYKNTGLEEYVVFDEISKKFLDTVKLSEHVRNILTYAFSEMMNNAIEHSQSEHIAVRFETEGTVIRFVVRDHGIGVFRNIQHKRNLATPLDAIQDLLKGKTTTMPTSHSGEGIFFTSKISDQFSLKSFGDTLAIDTTIDDLFVRKNPRSIQGTEVAFSIAIATSKHLNDVFRPYTDQSSGDFGFNTTEIHIKLYEIGGVHISRSQARRILDGLEKFSKVILDFKDIDVVGQAFADEVFRIFHHRHPQITFVVKNAIEPVQFMIDRVAKDAL